MRAREAACDGCAPIHHAHTRRSKWIHYYHRRRHIHNKYKSSLNFWAARTLKILLQHSRSKGERIENEWSPLGFFFVCALVTRPQQLRNAQGIFNYPLDTSSTSFDTHAVMNKICCSRRCKKSVLRMCAHKVSESFVNENLNQSKRVTRNSSQLPIILSTYILAQTTLSLRAAKN